ncbi:hypothetical protein [Methyloferula stellata]|uniref:hypothetical protein n=1 Tax=Methyloferula stellata TaxID=876270 RepID=UPI000375CB56|nr:hypothetical protein [Methyloferula stellata]
MLSFSSTRIDFGKGRIAVPLPRELRLALIACAFAIGVGTLIACTFTQDYIESFGRPHYVGLTDFLFLTQDAFWLAAVALLLGALAVMPLPILGPDIGAFLLRHRRAVAIGLTASVFVLGVAGTHFVFDSYYLSRDEILAEFDAVIFRSGRPVALIPPDWQAFANALAPRLMLPIDGGAGWVSGYLPVNAGFRAIISLIGDSNWTSPFLAACAIIATFGVARRLWPARPDAALVSMLLVATSSQMLVTSMTSYAMTGHLALNMIWLWFFLRNDKIGHGAAVATGFLAAGLHQLIFHPLFVLPFIVQLWETKRRKLALFYILSYAVICLFWIAYWKIVLAWGGLSPEVTEDTGPMYFVIKVLALLTDFHWAGADLMLKNILRFVSWQSPALLPLACLAYPAIRRGTGIAGPLMAGLLLTTVAMFFLLPNQAYGWGYRYIHGLIGSAALLGGYGWIVLTDRAGKAETGACRTMLVICSAFAWFILLPAHAKQAHDYVAPYIRTLKAIRQAPTDIVVVDKSRLFFAEDLVRNDPFLRNRPKVLELTSLTEPGIDYLCAHYSVSLFGYDQATALGIAPNEKLTVADDDKRAKLRTDLSQRCGTALSVPSGLEKQAH